MFSVNGIAISGRTSGRNDCIGDGICDNGDDGHDDDDDVAAGGMSNDSLSSSDFESSQSDSEEDSNPFRNDSDDDGKNVAVIGCVGNFLLTVLLLSYSCVCCKYFDDVLLCQLALYCHYTGAMCTLGVVFPFVFQAFVGHNFVFYDYC